MITYHCPRCKATVGVPANVPPPTCTCGRDSRGRGRLKPVEMVRTTKGTAA